MFKAILKGSVLLCFSNFENLIKAAGAWTAILFIFDFIAQMAGFDPWEMNDQPMMQDSADFVFFSLTSAVVQLIAASSVAVAWHRFALLGERPATIHLRFGRPEWRYFLYSLLFCLFMLAVLAAVGLMIGFVVLIAFGFTISNDAITVFDVLFLIGLVFTAPFFARAGLMLPAAAVDQPLGPFRALQFGKGFGWAMVFAFTVLFIPFLLLSILFLFVMTLFSAILPQLVVGLQLVLLLGLEQMVLTILLLSVVTITYAYAREREEAGGRPDA
ncbi:hypothetical protein [Breoghania sp. JC706]|uniref:hypothetical protein n=1 Tax=Breoghania sp. JC706 TaxID=3117732 RepID=UPI00300B1F16